LKCSEQTGGLSQRISQLVDISVDQMRLFLAIDMWSAGMILLFFLTGKFPLFQSNDDAEALLEIACIIGRRRMEKAATLHCERL
jgi:serine/threonine protein kinase